MKKEENTLKNAQSLYKKIALIRHAEERIQTEYFKDDMKTPVHLSIGAEAITAGVHQAVPKGSQYFGTYRSHALYLTLTQDLDSFYGELYGKRNGCAKGKAGSMHLSAPEHNLIATSAVVATTIPLALGAAMAHQMKAVPWGDKLAICFFGDGATEEGVFYESLNFASLKSLPILFVCEDNTLAIHTPSTHRQGYKSLKDLVSSFDIHYTETCGYKPNDVFEATSALFEKMKTTKKPGFIKCDYFRFLEHVGPLKDFDKGYRSAPAVSADVDPVTWAKKDVLAAGGNAEWIQKVDQEILGQIEQSVQKALREPFADLSELHTNLFSENGVN